MILCLLLLVQGTPDLPPAQDEAPPPIDRLLEQLADTAADRRDEAERQIRRSWERWTDADLQVIEKAASGGDAERAARAQRVLKRIRLLRAFATHLFARLDEKGALFIDGRTGAPEELFKPYAKPPLDPTGKHGFAGLRLFLEAHKQTTFDTLHAALSAAARFTPLIEVVLIRPSETPLTAEDARTGRIILFTVQAVPAGEDVDWKDKFIQEVNYHYQTHTARNEVIEDLKAEVARLEAQLREATKPK
jgi:hypothetical protein